MCDQVRNKVHLETADGNSAHGYDDRTHRTATDISKVDLHHDIDRCTLVAGGLSSTKGELDLFSSLEEKQNKRRKPLIS